MIRMIKIRSNVAAKNDSIYRLGDHDNDDDNINFVDIK